MVIKLLNTWINNKTTVVHKCVNVCYCIYSQAKNLHNMSTAYELSFFNNENSAFIISPCCWECNFNSASLTSNSLRLNSISSFLRAISFSDLSFRYYTAPNLFLAFDKVSWDPSHFLFLVSLKVSKAFKRTSSAFPFSFSIVFNFASFSFSALAS